MESHRFFYATMIIQEIPMNHISINCIISYIYNIPVPLVYITEVGTCMYILLLLYMDPSTQLRICKSFPLLM